MQHKDNEADATIAVIEVPLHEASRFGIMNTNENNIIYEFDEKPAKPKNNLASMGIYIFNWDILKEFLYEDAMDTKSSNDFGKNIIPKMLKANRKMYAYRFDGYWKDVGTIQSLWEANMDLLKDDTELDLYDKNWKIYSTNSEYPPQYISDKACIKKSMISAGCIVNGHVENSVLFSGVKVEAGAKISNSVIMPNANIKKDAVIERAIVGREVTISEGLRLNNMNSDEILLVTEKYIKENGLISELETSINIKEVKICEEEAKTSI